MRWNAGKQIKVNRMNYRQKNCKIRMKVKTGKSVLQKPTKWEKEKDKKNENELKEDEKNGKEKERQN